MNINSGKLTKQQKKLWKSVEKERYEWITIPIVVGSAFLIVDILSGIMFKITDIIHGISENSSVVWILLACVLVPIVLFSVAIIAYILVRKTRDTTKKKIRTKCENIQKEIDAFPTERQKELEKKFLEYLQDGVGDSGILVLGELYRACPDGPWNTKLLVQMKERVIHYLEHDFDPRQTRRKKALELQREQYQELLDIC